MLKLPKNTKAIVIAAVVFAALAVLVFNNEGLLKYYRVSSEVKKLNEEINRVDAENKNLQNEIDSLQKKVPAKIEKVAREKYGMIRKGETSVEIRQK